jgi:hypothetical protein
MLSTKSEGISGGRSLVQVAPPSVDRRISAWIEFSSPQTKQSDGVAQVTALRFEPRGSVDVTDQLTPWFVDLRISESDANSAAAMQSPATEQ